MELPKGSGKEVVRNEQGTLDRKKELDRKKSPAFGSLTADFKDVREATKAVCDTGLNVHALIGRYKKLCCVSFLCDEVIIDSCKAFLRYRPGIRGKPWPYFIRVLHTKYQGFKPKDVRIPGPASPVNINEILRMMGMRGAV